MRRLNNRRTLLLSLLLFFALKGFTQDSTEEMFNSALRLMEGNDSAINSKVKLLDSLYKKHYNPLNIQLQQFNTKHQMRSFEWQYYSGIIIYFLVITIVITGLILSYKQFQLNSSLLSKKVEIKETQLDIVKQDPAFSNSTMELGKDGIKINTAVIGLMILVISILFFFLYLKYVYPIQFVYNQ